MRIDILGHCNISVSSPSLLKETLIVGKFPDNLKLANITVFRGKYPLNKRNYSLKKSVYYLASKPMKNLCKRK